MAIGQGFHAKPSPTLGSLPAGLKKVVLSILSVPNSSHEAQEEVRWTGKAESRGKLEIKLKEWPSKKLEIHSEKNYLSFTVWRDFF